MSGAAHGRRNIFNCPISNVHNVLPINAFKITALAFPFSNSQSGGNMCLVRTYICLACGKLSVLKKVWKNECATMRLVSEGPIWELQPGKILLTPATTLVILNTVETLCHIFLFVFIVPGLRLQEEVKFVDFVLLDQQKKFLAIYRPFPCYSSYYNEAYTNKHKFTLLYLCCLFRLEQIDFLAKWSTSLLFISPFSLIFETNKRPE